MMAATLLLTVGTSLATGPEKESKTYEIDTKSSKITWLGKKVTGEHTGHLMLSKGTVTAAGTQVQSTEVTMNMSSITCTDLEDEGYNQKLVGHLKSEDFFSVEKFPTGSFEAEKFVPIANAKKGEANYTVKGKLTLKGITHELSFPAFVEVKDGKLIANGKATFDRAKYNIKYGSGSFFEGLGDKMIYDDVDLTFELVAIATAG